jgi:HK97 family phage major capsid protein
MPDATSGGVYRILGCIVKEDGSMKDGEVLFSDAAKGYQANVNKQISVLTEDHAKERTTDYCGYAIVDGAPVSKKAHALLKAKAAQAAVQAEVQAEEPAEEAEAGES